MSGPIRTMGMLLCLLLGTACGSGGGAAAPAAPACVTIEGPLPQAVRLLDLQVTIEVRFLTVSDSFFDQLGIDFDVMLGDPSTGVDTSDGASNQAGTSVGADTNAIGGVSDAWALVPQGQAGLQPLPILHPDFVSPTPELNITTNLGGGPCVDFGAGTTQTLDGLNPVPGGQLLDPSPTPTGLGTLTGILTDPQFQVILRAVESDGRSQVLQAPTVSLFDGQSTAIQAITERATVTDLVPEFATRAMLMNGAITVAETGPTLALRPTISEDRTRISLRILPAVQMVTVRWPQGFDLGGITPTGVMAPILKPRGVSGSVLLEDGQTLAIGGTLSGDGMTVERGVPLLGDLPLLGSFSRQHSNLDLDRNLMIFVTARIIDSAP